MHEANTRKVGNRWMVTYKSADCVLAEIADAIQSIDSEQGTSVVRDLHRRLYPQGDMTPSTDLGRVLDNQHVLVLHSMFRGRLADSVEQLTSYD